MEASTMTTVLIVEDDFAILFVAESSLRIEGYETLAAATRKDALSLLRSTEIDVLFTDINLRGDKRAGLDLAEKAVELKPAWAFSTQRAAKSGRPGWRAASSFQSRIHRAN
jgi:CheY-like chemotaxis protein